MRILAIDCATDACSVALFNGNQLLGSGHEVLNRGHAERLVPMIADLPGRGEAERILVSLGPGSFTGTRIGVAAARALGLAWQAEVLGYPTLALIAAQSCQSQPRPVTVCMAGGHGEFYLQNFDESGLPQDEVRSLPPAQAALACHHHTIAGNRAKELASLLGNNHLAFDLLPDAKCTFLLREELLTPALSPIYGRPPDAKLPAPRA